MKRLNYKECRIRLCSLFEKKRFVTKAEMFNILNLELNCTKDEVRFASFLYHTRNYAYREYLKAKKQMKSTAKIINTSFILNKEFGTMIEFIEFCKVNLIPYIHYIPQKRAYIFIEEVLVEIIQDRQDWIFLNGYFNKLKRWEYCHFPRWKNYEDYRTYIEKEKGYSLDTNISAILKKLYIFGESAEQMKLRLTFSEKVKKCNEKIDEYLYKVLDARDLELIG